MNERTWGTSSIISSSISSIFSDRSCFWAQQENEGARKFEMKVKIENARKKVTEIWAGKNRNEGNSGFILELESDGKSESDSDTASFEAPKRMGLCHISRAPTIGLVGCNFCEFTFHTPNAKTQFLYCYLKIDRKRLRLLVI